MKKRIFSLFLALCLCAMLAACGPFEDYDNDEAILKRNTGMTMVGAITNNAGVGIYDLTVVKANGIDKLATLELPETATFTVNLSTTSGRFKIVLCGGNSVHLIAEDGHSGEINVSLPAAGSYDLKIVAEDAGISLYMDYSAYV